jgi:hypothetical protein
LVYKISCTFFGYSFRLQNLMALTLDFLRILVAYSVLHMNPQEILYFLDDGVEEAAISLTTLRSSIYEL